MTGLLFLGTRSSVRKLFRFPGSTAKLRSIKPVHRAHGARLSVAEPVAGGLFVVSLAFRLSRGFAGKLVAWLCSMGHVPLLGGRSSALARSLGKVTPCSVSVETPANLLLQA